MTQTYTIEGMTCKNCEAHVQESLNDIDAVVHAEVNLAQKSATVQMTQHITVQQLQEALPDKYLISEEGDQAIITDLADTNEKSKLQALKPLFLILAYISVAAILLHREDGQLGSIMTDFMGLFFIVFSFFKMLDLGGFKETFAMYDPIASRLPVYGLVYPFIETILGLMLLLRLEVDLALVVTIVLLGCTTYGVTKTLLSKRKIRCACLGTALDLPMTEATFIENTIMIVMAAVMLLLV